MSTNICSYEGCMVRRYPCSSIAFFAIPTDNRRQQWIVNSGNKDLEKLDGTRTRLFCEKHFHHSDIRSQFNRKILRKSAIPKPYEEKSPQVQSRRLTENSYTARTEDDAVPDIEELSKDYELYNDNVVASKFDIVTNEGSEDENTEEMLSYTEQVEVDLIEETLEECEGNKKTLDDINLVTSANVEQIFFEDDSQERETRVTTTTITVQERDQMVDTQPMDIVQHSTETANAIGHKVQSSSGSTYDDDKHFALSLVGYFQRLEHEKKVIAKLKILTYLTALDLGERADL